MTEVFISPYIKQYSYQNTHYLVLFKYKTIFDIFYIYRYNKNNYIYILSLYHTLRTNEPTLSYLWTYEHHACTTESYSRRRFSRYWKNHDGHRAIAQALLPKLLDSSLCRYAQPSPEKLYDWAVCRYQNSNYFTGTMMWTVVTMAMSRYYDLLDGWFGHISFMIDCSQQSTP